LRGLFFWLKIKRNIGIERVWCKHWVSKNSVLVFIVHSVVLLMAGAKALFCCTVFVLTGTNYVI